MAKKLGRKATVLIDGKIACFARTKTLNIANNQIDVSTDCDDEWDTYLAEAANINWTLDIEGLYEEDDTATDSVTITDKALSEDSTVAIIIDYGTYTRTGTAKVVSVSEGFPHREATTFTATLQGTGALIKTGS